VNWGGIKKTKNDYLWSDIIRIRAKWCCEKCECSFEQNHSQLDAAHIHTVFFEREVVTNIAKRGKWTTRNDLDAGVALCKRDHRMYDHGDYAEQTAMITWISSYLKRDRIIRLLAKKNTITAGIKSNNAQALIRIYLENQLRILQKNG